MGEEKDSSSVIPTDDGKVVDLGETIVVKQCDTYPFQCVITRGESDPRGFIRTGAKYNYPKRNGHIYLSVSWLLRQAKALGSLTAEGSEELRKERDHYKDLCKKLVKDNEQALELLSRIESLESTGTFQRKVKTGRPISNSRYEGLLDEELAGKDD